MAKAKVLATLSPETFGLGAVVYDDPIRTVMDAQAYAVGEVIEAYSGPGYFPAVTSGGSSTQGKSVQFLGAGSPMLAGRAYVPPHAIQVEVSALLDNVSPGETATLNVTVGGDTISMPRVGDGVVSGTLLPSATGTGVLTIGVEGVVSGGTTPSLRRLRIATVAIPAGNLPDPEDE